MQATVTFTQHYSDSGTSRAGKTWVRNDFKTEDGQKFSTFDSAIASAALALLNQPANVEYQTPNPQYPNSHDIKSVAATNGGTIVQPNFPELPTAVPQIKPVDRNAGLARALETFAIESLSPFENRAELYELAEEYAAFGALGVKPIDGGKIPGAEPTV